MWYLSDNDVKNGLFNNVMLSLLALSPTLPSRQLSSQTSMKVLIGVDEKIEHLLHGIGLIKIPLLCLLHSSVGVLHCLSGR